MTNDDSDNSSNSQSQNKNAKPNIVKTNRNQSYAPQPIINLPTALIIIAIFLLSAHIIIGLIPEKYLADVIFYFAFIPQRITQIAFNNAQSDLLSKFAIFYTLITYTFLHGGWDHLLLNIAGVIIFGKLVILRLGITRFLLFSTSAAIFAILAHYGLNFDSYIPVIGISGVIYAYIGASTRFILFRKDIVIIFRIPNFDFNILPRLSIAKSLIQKTNMAFISFLIILNFILPQFFSEYENMAYEAHLAGLIFGMIFFSLFDKSQPNI